MNAKAVRPHIEYILDTLRTIEQYTPADHDTFMKDYNAQDATLMRLQDIGEQLTRIRDQFPDFFDKYHDESWFKIIGLRNVISHGYREVDFDIIWEVVTAKLPEFANRMRDIAKSQGVEQ